MSEVVLWALSIALVAVSGVASYAVIMLRRRRLAESEVEEPRYMQEVRSLAAQGDYRAAARVQVRNGNKVEAFNLLSRGGHHLEASELAEQLGQQRWAAEHAEKGGYFDRAAGLYLQCGEFGLAGRLYRRAGLFRQAAEAMERDATTDVDTLARMWQKACAKASAERRPGDPQGQEEVRVCAERAARAYEIAGHDERAAFFYEMCNRPEEAERLRCHARMFPDALPPLNPSLYGSALIDLKTINQFATAAHDQTVRDGRDPAAALAPVHRARQAAATRAEPFFAGAGRGAGRSGHHPGPYHAPAPEVSYRPSPPVPFGATPQETPAAPARPATPERPLTPAPLDVVSVPDPLTGSEASVPRDGERYVLGELIGSGRLSPVYQATDKLLQREVALKFFPPTLTRTPQTMECFEQAVRASSSLNHPGLVSIHNHGVMNGRPFIVMELVRGQSLEACLHAHLREDVGMPISEVEPIAFQLLTALEALHQRGVQHRDLRPVNVMIEESGQARIMDVGIIRATDASGSPVVGVTCYLPAEVLRGHGGDHRADLFALGVTLYEMLTGRLPFETRDRRVMPRLPSFFRPDVPEALDVLTARCLQHDPADRPASAAEALEILFHAEEEEGESLARATSFDSDNVIPLPSAMSHAAFPARGQARSADMF